MLFKNDMCKKSPSTALGMTGGRIQRRYLFEEKCYK